MVGAFQNIQLRQPKGGELMEVKDFAIIAVIVLLVLKFVRNNSEAYQFVNSPWTDDAPAK